MTEERSPRLGLTGYAVLGLLARTPRSAYEIAGALTRGFAGNLFARGATRAYEEPRRLAALGLATTERAWQGRRGRTVYSLTGEGRSALGDWLARESAPPVLELESLLKVFFGDAVDGGDPARAVDEVAAWASERFAAGAQILATYQKGQGRFQDNARMVRLTTMANIELTDALARWSRRAAAELASGGRIGFDDLAEELQARAAVHAAARAQT